ncbi:MULTISPECIES: DUF4429 domain-containing protein [Streptomyces]|uniref:DUF4429 domain-containing protein n=1 Tax=Streptomyces TaxID=1883 RepID=UPI000CD51F7F|nr:MULTISPECIES: DUF4429 domain-containing protein [Streptomyces]
MGDVLAGIHSSWEFDTDSMLIRFERGIRTPKLFHVLGERLVPYAALSAVEVVPGSKRGTVELLATPRAGADPLIEVADGQLRHAANPYRLVLSGEREDEANAAVERIRAGLARDAHLAADRFLVAAPAAPLAFKAYDGKVGFDGKTVSFRWFWTGATSAKWKAGDQSFQVGELAGVDWRSPEVSGGHLRLIHRGLDGRAIEIGTPPPADQDPSAVVFALGYGLVHESLPLAASVLEAVRETEPDLLGPPDSAREARGNPADIAERIRHLGDLHSAGLLTDDEFTTKKRDLLSQL